MNLSNRSQGLIVGNTKISHDIIVLEYSHSQKCFHSHSLIDAIYNNLDSFYRNAPNDYTIIGIFPSHEDLLKFQQKCIDFLNRPEMSDLTIDDLLKP